MDEDFKKLLDTQDDIDRAVEKLIKESERLENEFKGVSKEIGEATVEVETLDCENGYLRDLFKPVWEKAALSRYLINQRERYLRGIQIKKDLKEVNTKKLKLWQMREEIKAVERDIIENNRENFDPEKYAKIKGVWVAKDEMCKMFKGKVLDSIEKANSCIDELETGLTGELSERKIAENCNLSCRELFNLREKLEEFRSENSLCKRDEQIACRLYFNLTESLYESLEKSDPDMLKRLQEADRAREILRRKRRWPWVVGVLFILWILFANR